MVQEASEILSLPSIMGILLPIKKAHLCQEDTEIAPEHLLMPEHTWMFEKEGQEPGKRDMC